MSVRIVVCVDIDTTSLIEGYRELWKVMGEVEKNHPNIQWESSDEWYDKNGFALDEEDAQRLRMKIMNEKLQPYDGITALAVKLGGCIERRTKLLRRVLPVFEQMAMPDINADKLEKEILDEIGPEEGEQSAANR